MQKFKTNHLLFNLLNKQKLKSTATIKFKRSIYEGFATKLEDEENSYFICISFRSSQNYYDVNDKYHVFVWNHCAKIVKSFYSLPTIKIERKDSDFITHNVNEALRFRLGSVGPMRISINHLSPTFLLVGKCKKISSG